MTVAWIWTIVAVIGMVVSLANMLEAHQDRVAVTRSGRDGARRLLAWTSLVSEIMRTIALLFFALAGVIALSPHFLSEDTERAIITWGLVGGAGAIALNAALAFRTRRKLRELLQRDQLVLDRARRAIDSTDTLTREAEASATEAEAGRSAGFTYGDRQRIRTETERRPNEPEAEPEPTEGEADG